MSHPVTLIPGDGIGPEVAAATRTVLEATGVGFDWDEQAAGAAMLETEGSVLPERVLDSIRRTHVALKGPITTPVGTGFRSANVALRQGLDLFAAVRPARSTPGVETPYPDVDLVIVRENTEDLYAGIEFEVGTEAAAELRAEVRRLRGVALREDAGVTLKPISVSGARRIARFAFEHARATGRRRVTLGHKASVLKLSDGLLLGVAEEEAVRAGDIAFEAVEIDDLAMRLVVEPSAFDVLLLPNLYGDILSDTAAGLVGGLGLAAGANLGWDHAVFEPVHGSAPDIAGKGLADPIAMIRSGALLLRHVGEATAADAVDDAVDRVLREGRVRPRDLGGTASTADVTAAIVAAL